MPLYEFQCASCDHRFEVIRKFSDPPVDACPKCGGPVRKLLSTPAIQFKGSGWYITDYARKGTASDQGDAKPGAEKADGATSKPADNSTSSKSSPPPTGASSDSPKS